MPKFERQRPEASYYEQLRPELEAFTVGFDQVLEMQPERLVSFFTEDEHGGTIRVPYVDNISQYSVVVGASKERFMVQALQRFHDLANDARTDNQPPRRLWTPRDYSPVSFEQGRMHYWRSNKVYDGDAEAVLTITSLEGATDVEPPVEYNALLIGSEVAQSIRVRRYGDTIKHASHYVMPAIDTLQRDCEEALGTDAAQAKDLILNTYYRQPDAFERELAKFHDRFPDLSPQKRAELDHGFRQRFTSPVDDFAAGTKRMDKPDAMILQYFAEIFQEL